MPLKKAALVVPLVRLPGREKRIYERVKSGKINVLPDEIAKLQGVVRHGKTLVINDYRLNSRKFESLNRLNWTSLPPATFVRANAERIALIKQLNGLGFHIAVPKYGEGNPPLNALRKVKGSARAFSAKETAQDASWARDLYIKILGGRLKKFTSKGVRHFADGARIIPISEKVLFMSDGLKNFEETKALKKMGARIYFLKPWYASLRNVSRLAKVPIAVVNDHVDLFLGVAGKVILADSQYFLLNRVPITLAAKENGLSVVTIPNEEAQFLPANFLPIKENSVLVDRRAVKTISLLRASGVEVIPTAVSLRANLELGGGIRCIVNEL